MSPFLPAFVPTRNSERVRFTQAVRGPQPCSGEGAPEGPPLQETGFGEPSANVSSELQTCLDLKTLNSTSGNVA